MCLLFPRIIYCHFLSCSDALFHFVPGTPGGAIAGGVVGGLVLIALIVLIVLLLRRYVTPFSSFYHHNLCLQEEYTIFSLSVRLSVCQVLVFAGVSIKHCLLAISCYFLKLSLCMLGKQFSGGQIEIRPLFHAKCLLRTFCMKFQSLFSEKYKNTVTLPFVIC